MSLTRRTFLGACTAIGAMLGLAPVSPGKTEEEHSSRITFPPGTLVTPDCYRLPSGGMGLTPGLCWANLDFQVAYNGQDVTPLHITEAFTGCNGYVTHYVTEAGNPARLRVDVAKGELVRASLRGNVTFSYQPPENHSDRR